MIGGIFDDSAWNRDRARLHHDIFHHHFYHHFGGGIHSYLSNCLVDYICGNGVALSDELEAIFNGWSDISNKFKKLFDGGEKEVPLNIEISIAQRALDVMRNQSFPLPVQQVVEKVAKSTIASQITNEHINLIQGVFKSSRMHLDEIDVFVNSILSKEPKYRKKKIPRSVAQGTVEGFLASCQSFSLCISAIPNNLRETK